jgi:hypothetical protein
MNGKDRWEIGVARDILAIEARLRALESSRSVQPATETAAAGAGDPVREGEPQTLPPRETWPAHIRPRDEATAEPPASDGPGDGWRFVNVVGCRWCRER